MEDLVPKVQKAFESAFGIDQERVTIDSTPSDIPARDSMGHVQLAAEGSGYGQKSDTPKVFRQKSLQSTAAPVGTLATWGILAPPLSTSSTRCKDSREGLHW